MITLKNVSPVEMKQFSPVIDKKITHFSTQADTPKDNHEFIVAFLNDTPVGYAKLYRRPTDTNINVDFIGVNENHRHQGIATTIIERIFDIAKQENKIVTTDGFTLDGQKHIAALFEKLSIKRQQPIQFGIGRC